MRGFVPNEINGVGEPGSHREPVPGVALAEKLRRTLHEGDRGVDTADEVGAESGHAPLILIECGGDVGLRARSNAQLIVHCSRLRKTTEDAGAGFGPRGAFAWVGLVVG